MTLPTTTNTTGVKWHCNKKQMRFEVRGYLKVTDREELMRWVSIIRVLLCIINNHFKCFIFPGLISDKRVTSYKKATSIKLEFLSNNYKCNQIKGMMINFTTALLYSLRAICWIEWYTIHVSILFKILKW